MPLNKIVPASHDYDSLGGVTGEQASGKLSHHAAHGKPCYLKGHLEE
ncbi:MAG TPA: hypothetical protein VGK36_16465 [Candidatus Angelobacter sp.]